MALSQSQYGKENGYSQQDDYWNPVDPEEEAVDSGDDVFPDFPNMVDLNKDTDQAKLPGHKESPALPEHPKSLNEELSEKIKDDPNKFLGCGG